MCVLEYLNTISTETIILFAKDMLMSKARVNGILWGPAAVEPVITIWTTRSALCRLACCFLPMLLCCYFQNKFCKVWLRLPDPTAIFLFSLISQSLCSVVAEFSQDTVRLRLIKQTKNLLQCKTIFDLFHYLEIIWAGGFINIAF